MEVLEKEYDDNVVSLVNLLHTIAGPYPTLVADVKAVVQNMYSTFVQATNKVWTSLARTHRAVHGGNAAKVEARGSRGSSSRGGQNPTGANCEA